VMVYRKFKRYISEKPPEYAPTFYNLKSIL
jgi:hypothetical protein